MREKKRRGRTPTGDGHVLLPSSSSSVVTALSRRWFDVSEAVSSIGRPGEASRRKGARRVPSWWEEFAGKGRTVVGDGASLLTACLPAHYSASAAKSDQRTNPQKAALALRHLPGFLCLGWLGKWAGRQGHAARRGRGELLSQ